jgi:BNR/Asp-box repeat.
MNLRIATAEGLFESGSGAAATVTGPVRVFGDVLVAGGRRALWRGATGWTEMAQASGILCAVDAPGGLIIGTEGAHLLRLGPDGFETLDGFDRLAGRGEWYTPWGGPPEVRSLACTTDNVLLANVHVGGIARSDDGGRSWSPTIDIHDDIHQVRSVWGRDDLVVAAAAVGLIVSEDTGFTWRPHTRGLHATYCRAVAVPDQAILISASEGPRGKQSAIYRTNIHATERFDRVTDWIDGNVDSHALDGLGDHAAFGTPTGDVYESTDAGATWIRTRSGLPPVTSLTIVP